METWDKETIHLHVEISRTEPEDEEGRHCNFDDIVKIITECVEKIAGKEVYVRFRGYLPVARKDIPSQSAVGKLLAFSRKAGGAEMSLNGASLKIGDEIFSRLMFNYDDDDEMAFVTLCAREECEIDEGYMDALGELMEAGADAFVFERISREASHA